MCPSSELLRRHRRGKAAAGGLLSGFQGFDRVPGQALRRVGSTSLYRLFGLPSNIARVCVCQYCVGCGASLRKHHCGSPRARCKFGALPRPSFRELVQ